MIHRLETWSATVVLLLMSALFHAGAGAQEEPRQDPKEMVIDSFESGKLERWQASGSGDYYKGGFGAKGLSIVAREGKPEVHVLKAEVVFDPADPRAFITKFLEKPVAGHALTSVRLRYKLSDAELAEDNALILRLRMTSNSFRDYVVVRASDIRPGEWVDVDISPGLDRPQRMVNVWRDMFQDIREITLRLQGKQGRKDKLTLWVDDVRLATAEQSALDYEPRPAALHLAGHPRFLLIRHSSAGHCGVRDALSRIPVHHEVHVRQFRGLHFPIFDWPEDLTGYDVVAMIDVDTFVLTDEQLRALADYVAGGGALLVMSGPNSLAFSRDRRGLLEKMLPVACEEDRREYYVNAAPDAPTQRHALLDGVALPELHGACRMQNMEAKPDAEAVLTMNGRPLVVLGGFGKGRVAVINAKPEVRRNRSDALHSTESFGDLVRNLADYLSARKPAGRFSLARAAPKPDARQELEIEASFPFGKSVFAPRTHVRISTRLKRNFAPGLHTSGEGLALHGSDGAQLCSQGRLLDPWVYADEDPDSIVHCIAGAQVESSEGPTARIEDGSHFVESVVTAVVVGRRNDEKEYFRNDRLLRARRTARLHMQHGEKPLLEVETTYEALRDMKVERLTTSLSFPVGSVVGEFSTPEGKGRIPPKYKGNRVPLRTDKLDLRIGSGAGALRIIGQPGVRVWMQDLRFEGPETVRLEFESPFSKKQMSKGDAYTIRYRVILEGHPPAGRPLPQKLAWRLSVEDKRHVRIADAWLSEAVGEKASLRFFLPDVADGIYSARIEALDPEDKADRPLADCSTDFAVVQPLEFERFFPIISWLGFSHGGHILDEKGACERVDDLWDHGFNTVAYGGVRRFPEGPLSRYAQVLNAAERHAQTRGMAVCYEYENYTRFRRGQPHDCSVFCPEFTRKLHDYLERPTAVASAVPRVLSVKIQDEPWASVRNLDRFPETLDRYRARYGENMPSEGQLKRFPTGLKPRQVLNVVDFMGHCAAHEFRLGWEYKQSRNAPFRLIHTYMSPGYGASVPTRSIEDIWQWSPWGDLLDYDIYPYFYPTSQIVRFVSVHYAFGLHRSVGRFLGKPIGFYVELDDRNYPFQINPAKASAECAYTAIGEGCDYLNSFINVSFGTGSQSRPERWKDTGVAMRRIRDIAPLLKTCKTPRAKTAMLFGYTNWVLRQEDGAYSRYFPAYAHELLWRAHGLVDVVHERQLAHEEFDRYPVWILTRVEYLPRELARRLADYVESGGILIADAIPDKDEDGKTYDSLRALLGEGGEVVQIHGDMTCRIKQYGSGRTLLFSQDLSRAYHDAVEEGMSEFRQALEDSVAELIRTTGASPRVSRSNREFDAFLRLGENCALIIVVNHDAKPGTTLVVLRDLPFEGRFLVDLVTAEPLPFQREKDGTITLNVGAADRDARLLALYPVRPGALRLNLARAQLKRGESLRYRVAVTNAGKPARGSHVVNVTVRNPDGQVAARYGGAHATRNEELEVTVPIALNESAGRWTIHAVCPLLPGAPVKSTFTVSGD